LKEYFNRKQAAKYAGVSTRTILRAIEYKQLVAAKIGNGKTSAYLIEHHELENFMEKRKGRN
jgi:excisionase family DNA binding protein